MHKPTFQIQSLVSQKVGINIAKTVEDRHDAVGTENQAHDNTDGEQPVMRLVHDDIDGSLHIIHCPRGDEKVIQSHHHTLIKMRNRDVRDQGKEEQNQWEQRHKEIEGHACGTVDSTALGEQFEKINQHVHKGRFRTREAHQAQKVIVPAVPILQSLDSFLHP